MNLANLAFLTLGVGTSDPLRPGRFGPTLDTGAFVAFRAWEISLDVHREGDQALLFRGTASVTSLGLTWAPTWEDAPGRLVRVGLSPYLVLDLEPRTGIAAEVAYGTQGRHGALMGFVEARAPYWPDTGPLDGFTVGADLRAHREVGLVGLRAGLVGLRMPMVTLTVAAGREWGERRLGAT